jgi:hypothetical protein
MRNLAKEINMFYKEATSDQSRLGKANIFVLVAMMLWFSIETIGDFVLNTIAFIGRYIFSAERSANAGSPDTTPVYVYICGVLLALALCLTFIHIHEKSIWGKRNDDD